MSNTNQKLNISNNETKTKLYFKKKKEKKGKHLKPICLGFTE